MTLDPRAQLAQTMLTALASPLETGKSKNLSTSHDRDRLRKDQERRSMEALTQALLDPCTTVQEAVLESMLQRTVIDPLSEDRKNRASD